MTSRSTSYVRIFDTTLRDGEQSPGATMTSTEKLEVARALARLGVDVIEAGFPAASPDDLAAVRAIAEEVGARDRSAAPIICGLARASRSDIDARVGRRAHARRGRASTRSSRRRELHMQHKLRMTRAEVLERVAEMVALRARAVRRRRVLARGRRPQRSGVPATRCSRSRSTPARRRSTSPTPSATRRPTSSAR